MLLEARGHKMKKKSIYSINGKFIIAVVIAFFWLPSEDKQLILDEQ